MFKSNSNLLYTSEIQDTNLLWNLGDDVLKTTT